MTKGRIVWVIALLALLAAACGADPGGSGDDSTTSGPDTTRTPTTLQPVSGAVEPVDDGTTEPDPGAPLPELPDAKVPRALEPFVAEAIADLAERLGVDTDEITVAVAEFVVWPDGALGCPQPGMSYVQVQVEGVRTVLMHGQNSYSYHGGESNPGPFLCENLDK